MGARTRWMGNPASQGHPLRRGHQEVAAAEEPQAQGGRFRKRRRRRAADSQLQSHRSRREARTARRSGGRVFAPVDRLQWRRSPKEPQREQHEHPPCEQDPQSAEDRSDGRISRARGRAVQRERRKEQRRRRERARPKERANRREAKEERKAVARATKHGKARPRSAGGLVRGMGG